MPLQGLNHYSIRAADLARTRDFYVKVLGLDEGYRPPFDFEGHWLYAGGHPIVHLVGARPSREAGWPERVAGPTGLLDHIAFACTGLAEMRERLKESGLAYEERVVPRDRQTQIFVRDPDGLTVELNYPPSETPAS